MSLSFKDLELSIFFDRLEKAQTAAEITDHQLSIQIKKDKSYIRTLKKQRSAPAFVEFLRMAEVLDVSPAYLSGAKLQEHQEKIINLLNGISEDQARLAAPAIEALLTAMKPAKEDQ